MRASSLQQLSKYKWNFIVLQASHLNSNKSNKQNLANTNFVKPEAIDVAKYDIQWNANDTFEKEKRRNGVNVERIQEEKKNYSSNHSQLPKGR